jgi:uncharacterized membrane protein
VKLEPLSTQLWVAPVVGTLLALAVGGLALFADHQVDWGDSPLPLFQGTGATSRTFLSVVVASVTTLLALVFTIIAVIIQLASGQYTPRILRTLIKDKPTHLTIGIFVGAITYSLLCLQAIDTTPETDDGEITSLAVSLAFVMAVVAIGTFAVYSNHIVHAVRVENIIGLAGKVALGVLEREYPERLEAPDRKDPGYESVREALGEPDCTVAADKGCTVTGYDVQGLVAAAHASASVIVLVPQLGTFVRTGGTLLEIHGSAGEAELLRHVETGSERTTQHDLAYAIRQLVDIAVRALSPGDHDPTTSVQTLDHLHDVLARLATRRIDDGVYRDADGDVRLLVDAKTWDDYVELALDEVRRVGADNVQVPRRLLEMLDDLHCLAPSDRRGVLEHQRSLVVHYATEAAGTEEDARRATTPDRQGLGL